MAWNFSGVFEGPKDLVNAFMRGTGVEGRIGQSQKRIATPMEYNHLSTMKKKLVEVLNEIGEVTVCDLGGAAAIDFFNILPFLNDPKKIKWVVFELPEIYEEYNAFLIKTGYNLSCENVDYIEDKSKEYSGKKIFYTADAIQYKIPNPKDWLAKFVNDFDYSFLWRVLMGEETKTFMTIQIKVGNCWIYNQEEFLSIFNGEKTVYDMGELPEYLNDPFPEGYGINSFKEVVIKNV